MRVLLRLAALALVLNAQASFAEEPKRILVYGASDSRGWVPLEEGFPTTRFPSDARWPGVMQARLGDGYEVVEEALSGRTTNVTPEAAPIPLAGAGYNGAAYLPAALASHMPLDLVVIMLGHNDT